MKTLALLLFLGLAGVAGAQDTLSIRNGSSPWTISLVGGVDHNTLDVDVAYATDYHYEGRNAFLAGVDAVYDLNLPISGKSFLIPDFSLRGELLLIQKNYKFYRMAGDINYLHDIHTNNYLNIPLMAQISWGDVFHVNAFGGFYLGYWLSGRQSGRTLSLDMLAYEEEENTYYDQPYEFNARRDNRFDAGWVYGAGVGVSLGRIDINVDLRWFYALTDIQKQYMLFQNPRYNTTFAFTAGAGFHF